MKCSLCGFVFSHSDGIRACAACPLHHNCSMVRCPSCGFEMPELPGWYQKIRARFPGKKKNNKTDEKRLPENGAIVLTELAGGTSARIVSINNTDRRMLDTLFSFGALPGTVIELIRKYPAYVLRIGASVFTIDAELARSIFVKTI